MTVEGLYLSALDTNENPFLHTLLKKCKLPIDKMKSVWYYIKVVAKQPRIKNKIKKVLDKRKVV